MRKRLLAIVMSAAMVLSLVPSLAFAAPIETPAPTYSDAWTYILGSNGEVNRTFSKYDETHYQSTCEQSFMKVHVSTDGKYYDESTAIVLENAGHHATKYVWNNGYVLVNGKETQGKDCLKGTWTNVHCVDCDTIIEEKDLVPAAKDAAHTWSEHKELKAATCTEAAKWGYECTECGATDKVSPVGTANGHEIAKPITENNETSYANQTREEVATCIKEGKHIYKCKNCDYTEEYPIAKIPHNYKVKDGATNTEKWNAVVVEPATCTTPEYSIVYCTTPGCDSAIGEKYETAPALGHTTLVKDDKNSKAATCTEAGVDVMKCDREGCTYTETKEVPALGHNYAKVKTQVSPATCTEAEVLAYKCTREGCKEYSDPTNGVPAKGHSKISDLDWEPVYATCTEDRYMAKTCEECGVILDKRELTAEEIADCEKYGIDYKALGHMFILKEVKEATCSEEGLRTYVCAAYDTNDWEKRCGAVKEERIAKLPHTAEAIPAVAATYTKTGKTAGEKCSVCGTVTVAQKTVAKKVLAQAKTPTVKAGKGYIKVSYKAVKDATGYQIVVKRSGEKKVVTVKSAKAATKTIKKLKSGKTYKVYVRAYRTEGKTTVYGKYAPAKSIKVK